MKDTGGGKEPTKKEVECCHRRTKMWNRKTRIDTGAKEKRRPGVRRRERGENLLKRERGRRRSSDGEERGCGAVSEKEKRVRGTARARTGRVHKTQYARKQMQYRGNT